MLDGYKTRISAVTVAVIGILLAVEALTGTQLVSRDVLGVIGTLAAALGLYGVRDAIAKIPK